MAWKRRISEVPISTIKKIIALKNKENQVKRCRAKMGIKLRTKFRHPSNLLAGVQASSFLPNFPSCLLAGCYAGFRLRSCRNGNMKKQRPSRDVARVSKKLDVFGSLRII